MTGHNTRSVFERNNIVSECDLVEADEAQYSAATPAIRGPLLQDTTSDDRDGHNLGTVSPDRGPRLTISV
jgi:hypothetical protein